MLFFTVQTVIFTAMLFFVMEGRVALGMIFFILAEIGYRAAQVYYNGFLPEIATQDEMGRVAGIGWAIGSAGGVVCLLIVLVLILATDSSNLMVRTSFIITAVFFALSSIPLFLWLPEKAQRRSLPPGENYWSIAIKQLKETIRSTRGFGEFIKFMIAFLIYNDGVIMALEFAAILGGVLFGLDQQQLIVLMILVQIANVIGAYLFGVLQDKLGGKTALNISLVIMILDVIFLFFAQSVFEYFIVGSIAGFAMAGIQSVSRTMVGTFSPAGKSAEFYGFFALTGRTSSFIGPAVFGWLAAAATALYMNQGQATELAEQSGHRIAALSIAAFLIVGLVLLQFVNETKAKEAAVDAKKNQ